MRHPIQRRPSSARLLAAAALALAALLHAGCDRDVDDASILLTLRTQEDDAESPSATVLEGVRSTLYATAANAGTNTLVLPLVWSVSQPHLGAIAGSAGFSAVYQSHGIVGNNLIYCTDQAQRQGVAVVECVRPPAEETP
jgi:hypothetical protein